MVNVMIVEDQKMIRSILERYINDEEGYETVASIAGARRAVELCDTAVVDLVLMDVQTELREKDKGRPPRDKDNDSDVACGQGGARTG